MNGMFILHDNKGMPEWLDPKAYVHAIMENGDSVYAEAEAFTWADENDPIKAFRVQNPGISKTVH